MSLKIYRIDRSLFGKLNHYFKKPELPVLAGALFGNPFKNLADYNRENSYVLTDENEINRFKEAYGDDWTHDIYYIRHPKKIMTDVLIPATKFHSYITRELLSDMISYIRANLRIKELEVNISRNKNAKINIKSLVESVELEGGAHIDFSDNYTAKIQCNRPLKPSEKKSQFIWIQEYPHLISIIDNAEDGVFSMSEDVDLRFGLSLKAASEIGLEAAGHSNYTFNFRVVAA